MTKAPAHATQLPLPLTDEGKEKDDVNRADAPDAPDGPEAPRGPEAPHGHPPDRRAPDASRLLPAPWRDALAAETAAPYFADLLRFVAAERSRGPVYPPPREVFAALEATPLPEVKVVVVGQDPYHGEGQGHGLCFSVRPGVKVPPSLRNIYREMHEDLGHPVPGTGHLMPWARQGVLLLNTVLTVRAGEAHSHKGRGWERFTDAVLSAVAERETPAVFVLWGAHARKKLTLIDTARHAVVQGAHPSPLSVRAFRGSRPFTQIDRALQAQGHTPVDWRIPAPGEPA